MPFWPSQKENKHTITDADLFLSVFQQYKQFNCYISVIVFQIKLLIMGLSKFLYSSYPLNDAAETVNEIGASVRRVMGGTSGILYSTSSLLDQTFDNFLEL